MEEATTIGQIMGPAQDVINQNEDVRMARRRLQSESKRSLIVVDGDTPVGVLEWRQIMRDSDEYDGAQVREVMSTALPSLTAEMTVDEASARLTDVDVTTLPVVDDGGHLIGEVPRSAIARREEVVEDAHMFPPTSADDATARSSSMLSSLTTGMSVVGSSGSKIGEVSELVVGASGQLDAIIVKHGLLGRKHKRVAADLIDAVDGDRAVLVIDQLEFKALPDLEEVEERV